MEPNQPVPTLKPVKREARLSFAQFAAIAVGVLLLAGILLPALIGPSVGNIFSNIVRNL